MTTAPSTGPDEGRIDELGERIDDLRERVEDQALGDDGEPRFSDDGVYEGPGTDQNAPPG